MNKFSEFGLLESLVKTLDEKQIFKPTEIQTRTIPLLLAGQSVVGVSETGSGKTLAYALPLLHQLKELEVNGEAVKENARPRAIIMVPTRELGEQVSKVLKTMTHDTRLRVRPALGGMTFEHTRRNIAAPFEILLATPGRLIQLIDQRLIHLDDVRMLIFDEADQMLDQGFLPDSDLIAAACPKGLQLALFSATVSNSVQELMNNLFSNAEVIRSAGSGKTVKTLTTKNITVMDGKRWPFFEKVLAQPVQGGTLVFTNTREQCDDLAKQLIDNGFDCVIYRGEMDKNERRSNLKKFRDGKVDLLVSTDLAARGLDLDQVGRVINYHLPRQMENYLHRVGRTARAGRTGLVVNLVTERDERLLAMLEGKKVPTRKSDPTLRSKYQTQPKPEVKKTDRRPDRRNDKRKSKKFEMELDGQPRGKSFLKARAKAMAKAAAKTTGVKEKPEAKVLTKASTSVLDKSRSNFKSKFQARRPR